MQKNSAGGKMTDRSVSLMGFVFLIFLAFGQESRAAGTPAGTNLLNNAQVTFTDDNNITLTIPTNAVTILVNEILNVTILSADPGPVFALSPQTGSVLSFSITNTGNGSEAFRLAAVMALGGDQFDPSLYRIVLDSNGNGTYDASADAVYVPGGNDPVLNPDQSLLVFLLGNIPDQRAHGDLGLAGLTVTAVTGSGNPGTVFPGLGTGGADAVVGATRATATAQNGYVVQVLTLQFTKTQSVADPYGGSFPVPDAVITYTLTFALETGDNITETVITDPIPDHTAYVAGSLALDGNPLSDGADSDAGLFSGSAIAVNLGALSAPAVHTVTFQVRILTQPSTNQKTDPSTRGGAP